MKINPFHHAVINLSGYFIFLHSHKAVLQESKGNDRKKNNFISWLIVRSQVLFAERTKPFYDHLVEIEASKTELD